MNLRKHSRFFPVFAVPFILLAVASEQANGQIASTSLFEFDQESDAARLRIVNDNVMGGRSSSGGKIRGGQLQFSGNISLENNGGFASIRSHPVPMGMDANKTIVLRVRGDGRRYKFNLYTPDRRTAFSYQMEFGTIASQWVEVRLPVRSFVAHSFGRPLQGVPLDPSRVQSVGILLGDKRQGPFQITVDWIRME